MKFRNVFGVAASLVTGSVALSGTAFAAIGDFNYSTALSSTGGTTGITSTEILSTDANNYATFTNGANNTGLSAGPGAVLMSLTSYVTTAGDIPEAGVSTTFLDQITIKDSTTGTSQTQNLTGTYSGTIGQNTGLVAQTINQTSLTFVFADGTYTVGSFSPGRYGPPGGTAPTSSSAIVTFLSASAPEPSALTLAIPGVLGMVGFARRRKSAK